MASIYVKLSWIIVVIMKVGLVNNSQIKYMTIFQSFLQITIQSDTKLTIAAMLNLRLAPKNPNLVKDHLPNNSAKFD